MTLEHALIYATQKHSGQLDKAGKPYILHPLRVMGNLGVLASDEERMAALLHDVVEDCDVTLDELRAEGFPEAVVVAVDLLTKDVAGQADYQAAIERVAANPIARRVKIADLTDNMNIARIASPTPADYQRVEKYRCAREYLQKIEAA